RFMPTDIRAGIVRLLDQPFMHRKYRPFHRNMSADIFTVITAQVKSVCSIRSPGWIWVYSSEMAIGSYRWPLPEMEHSTISNAVVWAMAAQRIIQALKTVYYGA